MVLGVLRGQALAAGVVVLTSMAGMAGEVPEINLSRPHPLPSYPAEARQAGQIGMAVVAIHVNEIGKPFEVAIATSSGSPVLDKAATDAVRRWHFTTAQQDGYDVAAWTAVGFVFGPDGVKQITVSPDTEVARNERNQQICRTLPPITGSHIDDKPVCKPKWMWEDEARKRKDRRWHVATPSSTGMQPTK